jgi:hypothetical protein
MANIFSATIYGANQNDWGSGVVMGFPASQVVLRTIPPTSYSGVTCVTQIQLLPTAPSPIQPVYYTNAAIGTLIASGA